MATNDGYSPYPLGLTAVQAVTAITRAHNLSTELQGYVTYTSSATPPVAAKTGDLWLNSTSGKLYRASFESTVLVWLEV
jgi:hypothetical protein